MTLDELIKSLKSRGVLRSPAIERALKKIDRKKFVPEEQKAFAYEDIPLPIGEGQTISQPYTVVFMLELLQPHRGQHLLDVGAGSGWQTCLLADIVEARGRVYALEVVPTLCEFGKYNIAQFPELQKQVEFFCQSAAGGLPDIADKIGGFDAIIAAAEVREVPEAWREELKIGGRLVYPRDGALVCEVQGKRGVFREAVYPGFVFVPFV